MRLVVEGRIDAEERFIELAVCGSDPWKAYIEDSNLPSRNNLIIVIVEFEILVEAPM